mmetsp:Transcript_16837/g.45359  ORF Transcript_16837/g.45359 Transcript_16837/m.45359 type:complete len:333 (-) Transcript_16837:638-1636(-)
MEVKGEGPRAVREESKARAHERGCDGARQRRDRGGEAVHEPHGTVQEVVHDDRHRGEGRHARDPTQEGHCGEAHPERPLRRVLRHLERGDGGHDEDEEGHAEAEARHRAEASVRAGEDERPHEEREPQGGESRAQLSWLEPEAVAVVGAEEREELLHTVHDEVEAELDPDGEHHGRPEQGAHAFAQGPHARSRHTLTPTPPLADGRVGEKASAAHLRLPRVATGGGSTLRGAWVAPQWPTPVHNLVVVHGLHSRELQILRRTCGVDGIPRLRLAIQFGLPARGHRRPEVAQVAHAEQADEAASAGRRAGQQVGIRVEDSALEEPGHRVRGSA